MTEHEVKCMLIDQVHVLRRSFDLEGFHMSFDDWRVNVENDKLQIEHGTKYQPGYYIWDCLLMPKVAA